MTTHNVLVLLQENTGKTGLQDVLPPDIYAKTKLIIDAIAENLENFLINLQGVAYDKVHILTHDKCTRANLLQTLINERNLGRAVDLIILGHGEINVLGLYNNEVLTGQYIRSMLAVANMQSFSLRLVYMCNCYGSTLNDDWLAIGAKVSIGPLGINCMPEPTTTTFITNWNLGDNARSAADKAYQAGKVALGLFLNPGQEASSQLVVKGREDLSRKNRTLFLAPVNNTPVYDTVTLRALGFGVNGMEFGAYYASNPADMNTINWRTIGQGQPQQNNEWTFDWDTTTVPNQGNAGWGTVNISASPKNAQGNILPDRDYSRIDINNCPIQLVSPAPNDTCKGIITLKAYAPGAPSVGFSAYYLTNPDDINSAGWHEIGIGTPITGSPGNWQTNWDTRMIPNQGNAGWGIVNICANVRGMVGNSLPPSSGSFVNLRNYYFISPKNNSKLSGIATLKANVPKASRVLFTAYYCRNPQNIGTVGWHFIGEGTKLSGDVWAFAWDTRNIPNQGDPGLGLVNLAIIPIDTAGNQRYAGGSGMRVLISNP